MPQFVINNSGNGTVNVYNCQGPCYHRNGHGNSNNNGNDSSRDHYANDENDCEYRNRHNNTDVYGGTETEYINVEHGGEFNIIVDHETENLFQNLNNEKREPTKDINNITSGCDDATSRDRFNQDNRKEIILLQKFLKNCNIDHPKYPKCDSFSNDIKSIDNGGDRKIINGNSSKISGHVQDNINPRVCVFVYVVVCHLLEPIEQQHYINATQTLENGGAERAQMETGEGTSRLVTNEERGTTLIRQQRPPVIDVSTRTVELHTENNSVGIQQSTPVEAIWFYYVGVADFICCWFCGGGIRNWNNSVAILTLIHGRYYPNCPQNIQHPRTARTAEIQNNLHAITNDNVSTNDVALASENSPLETTEYLRRDLPSGELTQAERTVRNMSPIHGLGYPYCPHIQHPHSTDVTEIQNDQNAITNGHVSTRDEAQTPGNSPLDTTENQRLDHSLGDLNQAEPSVAILTLIHGMYYPNCPQNIQHPRTASTAEIQNNLHAITNGSVSTRDEAQVSGNYVSGQRVNLQPNDQRVQGNERTRTVYSLSTANAGLSNRPSRTDVTNMPGLNADRVFDTESEASTEVENHRNTNIGVRNRQDDNIQLLHVHPNCQLCLEMPAEEICQNCGNIVFCKYCFTTTVECSRCKSTSSQDEVG